MAGSGKGGKYNALGCWRSKSLWPLMAGSGWSAFFLCPLSDRGVVFLTSKSRSQKFEIQPRSLLDLAGAVLATPAAGLVEMKVLFFVVPGVVSFLHSLIRALTHSFIHSFIYLVIYLLIHSLIHSSIHSFIDSFIHSLIHLSIHSFVYSFTHSFI